MTDDVSQITSDRLALLVRMRLGSARLPEKMLRRVGEQTLAEAIITKCQEAARVVPVPVYCFLSPKDEELWKTANRLDCPVIQRSDQSASAPDAIGMCDAKMLEDLRQMGIERVLFPNACMPFLTPQTIAQFIVRARYADYQFITVHEHQGWVFDHRDNKIWGDVSSSKRAGLPYKTVCSTFFFAFTENLGKPEMFQAKLVTVPKTIEFLIDIDTPEDLQIAQAVWYARHRNDVLNMCRVWEDYDD